MNRRLFIGLSAGASLFGVDAALVSTQGIGRDLAMRLEHFLHVPYSNELRELLVRVTNNPMPETKRLAALHRVLGEHQALAVRQLLEHGRVPAREVMAVGCSGVSLWHDSDGRYPSTLSLGMSYR
jgi:anhydro-N-acetylmuramic acid kinase